MKMLSVYVGLNDATTKEQKFSSDKYMSVIRNICRSYRTGFTLDTASGGYFMDDGTFVDEESLVVSFLGVDREIVEEIAADICAFFNQESVIITDSDCEVKYISESLNED